MSQQITSLQDNQPALHAQLLANVRRGTICVDVYAVLPPSLLHQQTRHSRVHCCFSTA